MCEKPIDLELDVAIERRDQVAPCDCRNAVGVGVGDRLALAVDLTNVLAIDACKEFVVLQFETGSPVQIRVRATDHGAQVVTAQCPTCFCSRKDSIQVERHQRVRDLERRLPSDRNEVRRLVLESGCEFDLLLRGE